MRATSMSRSLAAAAAAVLLAACGPAKPAESASHGDEAESLPPSHSVAVDADQPPPEAPAAPAPPAPAAASPAPSPPALGGGGGASVPYDKEAVQIGLKRAARQVKANCGAATGDDGKANGPWGKATVTVKLGHNGHSAGATVEAPFDGNPVGKCIAQAFAILIYPPFAGSDTTVEWPVEVVPPAGH